MSHLHLRQSAELLQAILAGTLPADAQMDQYFRTHREMGGRDRGEVAETVYACLRHRRLLAHLCENEDPVCLAAAQLLRAGISARALEEAGFRPDARVLATRVRALDAGALPLAVRESLPDWLIERMLAQYGPETEALAAALNRPAPVDLRVNSLKGERADVQARLAAEGFPSEPTPYSPLGLRRATRESLFRTSAFRDGLFEVQDEGSQLLAFLLEPRRHEMVVDFCAGAGGKTLQLGALMAGTGTLYAFDVSERRLEKFKPRLRRSGLQNVRTVVIAHERDERVRRLAGKVDRVLVDAPCSGTGTLRRNPDIKWRRLDLEALAESQKKILDAAAALVKPGGRLVYATCSLLREENETIVTEFLAQHGEFESLAAGEILARRKIALPPPAAEGTPANDPALRLLPHRHGTDGFYAVALERRK